MQVGLSVLNRESGLMVSCDYFDKFDNGFASLSSELNMVRVRFVVKFVISTIIFGFFRCAQVLRLCISRLIHLF